jgi:hypothetical protein
MHDSKESGKKRPRRGPPGPKPYKFIGFGEVHGPKPYKFIGFGDIKPYKSVVRDGTGREGKRRKGKGSEGKGRGGKDRKGK